MMYTLERGAQPEAFNSIPHSIWWAVVTMTTVGYGDVTPVTFGGRLMAGLIMLLGVGIVALPAGMLAARFGEELKSRKDRLRVYVRHALQDGHVDELEQSELEHVARELDISKDALEQLIELQKAQRHISMVCPHCGKGISTDKKS
jgi:voltage-gated potassium channel